MSGDSKSTFLFIRVKKNINSLFSFSNEKVYEWTQGDDADAIDITDWLSDPSKSLTTKAFEGHKLVISFDGLNRLKDKNPEINFVQAHRLLNSILVLLDKNCLIGIDFKEIVLTKSSGRNQYSGFYDPNNSVETNDDITYKQHIDSLSYRFGKALFQYSYRNNFFSSNLPLLIASDYVSHKTRRVTQETLYRPLNQFYFYQNIYECLNYHKNFPRYQSGHDSPFIFAFDYPISYLDLAYLFQHFKRNIHLGESIVVIRDLNFLDKTYRQKWYQAILAYINQDEIPYTIHFILLTKTNINENLLDLAPSMDTSDEQYQPLANDAGYFLSSKVITELLFNNSRNYRNPLSLSYMLPIKVAEDNSSKQSFAFIMAQSPHPDMRPSKMKSPNEIKAQAHMVVTQQQATNQANAITEEQLQVQLETQTETQQQLQSTEEQITKNVSEEVGMFGWSLDSKISFKAFCDEIKLYVDKHLNKHDLVDPDKSYYHKTPYYLDNLHDVSRFRLLSSSAKARMQMAAKIYGVALIEDKTQPEGLRAVSLPHYSIDYIDDICVNEVLLNWSYTSLDNDVVAMTRKTSQSLLFGTVLNQVSFSGVTGFYWKTDFPNNKLTHHSRHYASKKGTKHFYSVFTANLLLPEVRNLYQLSVDERISLNEKATRLIVLYQLNPPTTHHELESLAGDLLDIIEAHIPEETFALSVIKKIIQWFNFNNDIHLKLLLELILYESTSGLEQFANVITAFEKRGLIPFLYRYCFQYAYSIDELRIFMDYRQYELMKLVKLTPLGSNRNDWPFNVALGFELLLLAKASNQFCLYKYDFQKFCKRLYAKFYAYLGDETEALGLLDNLKHRMIDLDGLRVKGYSNPADFCESLECLLDNAIANHVLEEQINEITDLSLLPRDALYAIKFNGFKLICPEMFIQSSDIDPNTQSYIVSKQILQQVIIKHTPNNQDLAQKYFRYLGVEAMREDMDYYRKLYHAATYLIASDEARALNQQLCAFYILLFTGEGFCHKFDAKQFKEKFKSLGLTIDSKKIDEGISHLVQQLHQIPKKEQRGIQTIWLICRQAGIPLKAKPQKTMPAIFLHGFNQNRIGLFLMSNREALQTAMFDCYKTEHLPVLLINHWCQAQEIFIHAQLVNKFIHTYYPSFNWATLLDQVNLVAQLINAIAALTSAYPESLIYFAIDLLIEKKPKFNLLLSLLTLMTKSLVKYKRHFDIQHRATQFVVYLSEYPQLLTVLLQKEAYFSAIFHAYLLTETNDEPRFIADIVLTLSSLPLEQAEPIFESLTSLFDNQEVVTLLNLKLSAVQLRGLVKLRETVSSLHSFLYLATKTLEQEPTCDFGELITLIIPFENEPILKDVLISLTEILYATMSVNILTCLQTLSQYPLTQLQSFLLLVNFYNATPRDLVALLAVTDVPTAIQAFKENKRHENLDRYAYNSDVVKAKIATIRRKSIDETPDCLLSEFQQTSLWNDYQAVMAYMQDKPISFEINGQVQQCTMVQMDDDNFKILFKIIQYQLSCGHNRHAYQLMLIALSVEAMYRCTHKFPRYTQILTLLQYMHYPNNIIHEYETGQGKSIITALHVVFLCADGYTADIATENLMLADEGLSTFNGYYDYLGIPHGDTVLLPNTTFEDYVLGGVNYSTPANLALFRIQMAIKGHEFPQKTALIADEIDAALTTTVQYRLAQVLDPSFNDIENWTQIYLIALDFIQESKIFLENNCSQSEDVTNLRHYFISKKVEKTLLKIIDNLDDKQLNDLIDAAMIGFHLKEKDDYFPVMVNVDGRKQYVAAPIIKSTHRPDPNVSYSNFVQQIIHAKKNSQHPRYPFVIEPCTETIVVVSASNFFSDYRLNNGPIIGLTATSGSTNELLEFKQQQGLQAFNFPSFHDSHREDLGLIAVFGETAHIKAIEHWLVTQKINYPTQPILLFTASPNDTDLLTQALSKNNDWPITRYHGIETNGYSEAQIILIAGSDKNLTISNQSMARGTNVTPTHERGLVVVNLIADLTEDELKQMYGRAGRNGMPGQQISIINAEKFANATDTVEQIATKYKEHQRAVSLERQQKRQQMRLLEEVRHHLVTKHLLKVRRQADVYLKPQFGEMYSLVSSNQLALSLSKLNQELELHYQRLLQAHNGDTAAFKNTFLAISVSIYQSIFESFFPLHNFESVVFVAPSVPLSNLNLFKPLLADLTLEQLYIIASLPHMVWKQSGHQLMQEAMITINHWLLPFEPYFKKQCSFMHNLGEVLDAEGLFSENNLNLADEKIQDTLTALLNMADLIPIIGSFVPKESVSKFFENYLNTTKQQIHEKRWDDIQLPQYDLSTINTWLSNVSTGVTVASYAFDVSSLVAGPIPFIVNRFVVPVVLSWAKNLIKQLFAQSENILAQLLVALDDIAIALPKAIIAVDVLRKKEQITVGDILDNFGEILKNKALNLVVIKLLEYYELEQYKLLIYLLPMFIDKLEARRNEKLETLFKVDTLLECIQYAATFPEVAKALDNPDVHQQLLMLSQLNPESIKLLANLNLAEFMQLLSVLAHPTFYAFMQKLPSKLTYASMINAINHPEDTQDEVQSAVTALFTYQNDLERIAKENKYSLLQLKGEHTLSEQKLATELERLVPRIKPEFCEPVLKPQPKPTTSRLWSKISWQDVMAAMALTALVVVTALYFSPTMLLLSLGLAAFILTPYAYRLGKWAYHKYIAKTKVEIIEPEPLKRQPIVEILKAPAKVLEPSEVKHYSPLFKCQPRAITAASLRATCAA